MECGKELDSPIFTVYEVACQTYCTMNCLRAVSHSFVRVKEQFQYFCSKDINGLTLTATLTFSDSPSDISSPATRYNDQRSQKLSQNVLLARNEPIETPPNATCHADVQRILEIFQAVLHAEKRNKEGLCDYRH